MGSVIEKRHRGELVEEVASKEARQVGRLSMIIRAMRPRGHGAVGSDDGAASSSGPSSTSAWSKMFSNRARLDATPPYGTLPEQDEANLARENDARGAAAGPDADGTDFVDRDGKLNYDIDFAESDFEDPCSICNMYKRDGVLTCRVCGRPFHHGCILGRGQGLDANSAKAMENADTDLGWSCPDCEALGELISMDDMCEMMMKFDHYDTDGDSIINMSNYMEYESTQYQREYNDCIPGSKVKECEESFREYDRDNDGVVSWWDYSTMEAVKLLQRAPQVQLLEHLRPKEIAKLRRFFKMSDKLNLGLVTVGEAEQAYRGWLRALGLAETEEAMRSFERSTSTNECNKTITWERFVRNKVLALITSRPNTPTIKPYVTSQYEAAL